MEGAGKREGEGGGASQCCPLISVGVRAVVTVACCFLFCCTLGTLYAFGNINPYLTSYLRNRTGDGGTDFTDTLWVFQTQGMVTSVLMPVVGMLANRLHTKLFLAIGFLCHTGSLVGTFFTVQQSFPLVVLTYGVLYGISPTVVDAVAIRLAVQWVPQRRGLIVGVVLMGYGVGGVVWNQVTTLFINPHNLEPDLTVGEDVYYSQAEVLDKVPCCFLLLGVVCGSVQFLGTLLLCLPPLPPPTQMEYKEASAEEKRRLLDSDDDNAPSLTINSDTKKSAVFGGARDGGGQSSEARRVTQAGEVHYHPRQVLTSRVFWTLWCMCTVSCVGYCFIVSLFKAYGETFISDDHFLALVASISSVCNAVGRPLWGLLSDRIGLRMVSLVAQCLLTALVGSLVVCEVLGQMAFMVWVCLIFTTLCGYFTMMYAIIFAIFGSHHYNVNMGLLATNGLAGTLLPGLLAPTLKDNLGWHGIFFFSFGGLFLGVLLNLSLSIRPDKGIPRHMWTVLSLRSGSPSLPERGGC
ncbi:apicoplast pyruvate carrier 1-like [Babylonia areolata]|uniref:apicoplast pyruvate carrier 1-like n=1 Tax=Babylonia areolata TaxID=304850 RepID=UPI003FD1CBF7